MKKLATVLTLLTVLTFFAPKSLAGDIQHPRQECTIEMEQQGLCTRAPQQAPEGEGDIQHPLAVMLILVTLDAVF